MFDYERYDHTYCRLSKDVEGTGNLKRRLSSASYEGMSDIDINEHAPSTQISVERDNGVSLNREPVIIVRTKKARKTAPIIVKAMNKDGGAVLVSTVPPVKPVNSGNSIINKKIVCPVPDKPAESVEDIGEEKTEELEENKMDETKEEMQSTSDVTVDANAGEVDEETVVEEPPQTTKSGRTRKLTAKAKQISEESKKGPKSKKPGPKAKSSVGNQESKPKRSRGRPRKVDTSAETTASITAKAKPESRAETTASNTAKAKPESNTETIASVATKAQPEAPSSEDTTKGSVKTSDKNRISNGEKPTNRAQRGRRRKATLNSNTSPKSPQPVKPAAKPGRKVASVAKTPSKPISKSSPVSKRGRKSKLVVVTKPPPKRQAQLRAKKEKDTAKGGKSGAQSIPAAKIDSSNIVRGSRRRR